MLTKFFKWLGIPIRDNRKYSQKKKKHTLDCVVIPRADHTISRKQINPSALKVLYRLEASGFEAYLVGGSVRDLLLGEHPKDFDIATNATPEQVYRLFRNSRMIGRRFKLVHVFFGSYIVEVATFRAPLQAIEESTSQAKIQHSAHGMIVRDNLYGTLEEDVWRRDFTVNALYYTISDFSVIDYVGGLEDLQARSLRIIGDACLRYREDPVRMLRAIRFAAKLNFSLHPETAEPILELANLLTNVAAARLFEECLKLFFTGYAEQCLVLLQQYGLLTVLFPVLDVVLSKEHNEPLAKAFILKALQNTDERVKKDQPVAIPFLIGILLWPAVQMKEKQLNAQRGSTTLSAGIEAIDWALKSQQTRVAIPKRFTQMTRELWVMQLRLSRQNGHRAHQLFMNLRFRAAYDFLMLRAEAGDTEAMPMASWWTKYIESDENTRLKMMAEGQMAYQKRKQKEKLKMRKIMGGKKTKN